MNMIASVVAVVGLGLGAVGVAGFGTGSCGANASSCATPATTTAVAGTMIAVGMESPSCAMCEAKTDGTKCAMCASHDAPVAEEKAADACPMCEAHGDDAKCDMCASHEMPAEGAGHAHDMGNDMGHHNMEMTAASMDKKIDPALYQAAAWPTHNKGDSLYAKDLQGQMLPVALGKETWITKKVKTKGKVIVLDFWATWCPPCRAAMPMLSDMQKKNKDTLSIIAIGGQSEGEDAVRSFVEEHEYAMSDVFDANQSVFTPFESEGIPLVVVISTDGVIRWIGNPHQPEFAKAVKQTIAVDPMVNAS